MLLFGKKWDLAELKVAHSCILAQFSGMFSSMTYGKLIKRSVKLQSFKRNLTLRMCPYIVSLYERLILEFTELMLTQTRRFDSVSANEATKTRNMATGKRSDEATSLGYS